MAHLPSFPGGKLSEAPRWPLTTNWCRNHEQRGSISYDVGFNPSTQRHYRRLIYYLYIHSYMFRSYDHLQVEIYTSEINTRRVRSRRILLQGTELHGEQKQFLDVDAGQRIVPDVCWQLPTLLLEQQLPGELLLCYATFTGSSSVNLTGSRGGRRAEVTSGIAMCNGKSINTVILIYPKEMLTWLSSLPSTTNTQK
jgi:hypothetical protein